MARLPLLRPLFAALLACAGGGVALAAPGCRLLDNVGGQLASVTGSGRAALLRATAPDGLDCPAVGRCGQSGFVLPGDPLVAGARSGRFTCVTFVSPVGRQTTAWLDGRRLRAAPPPAASPNAWAGVWRLGPEEIAARLDGRALSLRGYAQWPWAPAPDQQPQDFTPNLGNIQQRGTPQGDRLAARGNCSVNLRLLGPYLLVQDPPESAGLCWGVNVTFSGVYRRASPTVSDATWADLATP